MNLTTFAWDCYDGQVRTEEHVDDSQKKSRITRCRRSSNSWAMPLLPWCSQRPSTRFCDYRAWSTGELFASPKGKEKASTRNGGRASLPTGRLFASFRELFAGIGFMAIYSVFAPAYSYEKLIGLHGGLSHLRWYQKLGWIQVAVFMARTKYYGIWSLTDGACILSGLGYNVVDPALRQDAMKPMSQHRHSQDRVRQQLKELLDHWNMNTNVCCATTSTSASLARARSLASNRP